MCSFLRYSYSTCTRRSSISSLHHCCLMRLIAWWSFLRLFRGKVMVTWKWWGGTRIDGNQGNGCQAACLIQKMDGWFCYVIIMFGNGGNVRVPDYIPFVAQPLMENLGLHYSDLIMGTMATQITSLAIVHSTVFFSGANQRKHQSSASLAFVRGIHRSPVNSPHKRPVTRKMFPLDDVIMSLSNFSFKSLLVAFDWLSSMCSVQ